MPELARGKTATVTIHPHNQNLESVNKLLAYILKVGGCGACGRLAVLKIDFLADPPPDLAKEGVISIATQGF